MEERDLITDFISKREFDKSEVEEFLDKNGTSIGDSGLYKIFKYQSCDITRYRKLFDSENFYIKSLMNSRLLDVNEIEKYLWYLERDIALLIGVILKYPLSEGIIDLILSQIHVKKIDVIYNGLIMNQSFSENYILSHPEIFFDSGKIGLTLKYQRLTKEILREVRKVSRYLNIPRFNLSFLNDERKLQVLRDLPPSYEISSDGKYVSGYVKFDRLLRNNFINTNFHGLSVYRKHNNAVDYDLYKLTYNISDLITLDRLIGNSKPEKIELIRRNNLWRKV